MRRRWPLNERGVHSSVRLQKDTKAVFDSDYQGAQKEHANTVLPLKKPKGGKLTKAQKQFNKLVAQERIANENVADLKTEFG